MIVILWILIILAFITAYAGLVFPVVPGILMMWIGFLIYQFGINDNLSIFFWIGMATLTIFTLASDYIASSYFVKQYGGSKAGEITAAIGVLIGSFIYPPFGMIILPFLAVFIVEMILVKDPEAAFKASVGSLFGFLASTVAKFMILIIMTIWFFIDAMIG